MDIESDFTIDRGYALSRIELKHFALPVLIAAMMGAAIAGYVQIPMDEGAAAEISAQSAGAVPADR